MLKDKCEYKVDDFFFCSIGVEMRVKKCLIVDKYEKRNKRMV